MRDGARREKPIAGGFTLIEVVVVMLVLTIILGIVGVRLTRDESDIIRDEARRLSMVLQSAQQQAILEGRLYAFAFGGDGYRFLRLNSEGRLVPIEADELLGPRLLPPPMTLEPVRPKDSTGEERRDLVLFDPSGEFPAFTMVFNVGELVWYVTGRSDGQIRSSPQLEPTQS
jgi:general secretion pathway protein H